jgi:hypothetical protein
MPQLTSPHTGNKDSTTVSDFFITSRNMSQVYISLHPYKDGLEIDLDLCHKKHYSHPAAGMKFITVNGCLILQHIDKGTLTIRIPCWQSESKGAWLRDINSHPITMLNNIFWYLDQFSTLPSQSCILTFSRPKIPHGLSNDGIPQVNIDQLNPCNLFSGFEIPPLPVAQKIDQLNFDGDVFNFISRAMHLTCGKLIKTPEWGEWQQSEYTMLDQYEDQGLFEAPVAVTSTAAVFNLAWTYIVKELDKRKKACCTCDGSSSGSQARVLNYTYSNCVEQTSSWIICAASSIQNLIVFGADVSNTFVEAPPPKQDFYIRPDKAYLDWWTQHKRRPRIPPGFVIPVLSAMQGHPESP